MRTRWYLLCLLFSFSLHAAFPQSIYDYDIKHWNSADGLSSNSARTLTQDSTGYIWVGTLFGLNRFDGYSFESFTTQQHRQLASNAINVLLTDSQGDIWVGTKAGLSLLDPHQLSFERLNILTEVTALAEVRPGEVWVAAEQLFRVREGEISRISSIREPVSQLRVSGSYVWLTTSSELIRYDMSNGEQQRYPLPAELKQNPIYDISVYDDELHLASELGYYRLTSSGTIERCGLLQQDNNAIYRIFRDQQGADWVSSYSQLYHRHFGQNWQHISSNELGSAPWFYDIFEDRDHNIWLASFSDGIFRASPGHVRRIVGQGQHDAVVRSVAVTPEQRLLIATQSGLGYLSRQGYFQSLLSEAELGSQTIHDIFFHTEHWWLATDVGVYQFEPETKYLTPIFPELQGSTVRLVQPRAEGGVWIGGSAGLYYWQDEQLHPFLLNRELESRNVTVMSDQVWYQVIGSSRGLYQLQQNRLQRLGIGTPLYNSYITAMLVLPDDHLLVGTLDDGFFIRYPDNEWVQFDNSNGLPHSPVVSILFDEMHQQVWLSTLKGVFRFSMDRLPTFRSEPFQAEHVLTPYQRQLGTAPGRCCNGAGHAKVAMWHDQLWYPSLQGVVAIERDFRVKEDQDFRPVLQHLTGQRHYQLIPDRQRLVLPMNERSVSLHYTALDFFNAQALDFRYQLNGFDVDWQYAGSRREAIYTNLLPGNYQFSLQVRHQNQSWSDAQGTSLTLMVPRRFDETTLYRALWLALLAMIVYAVFWLFRRNHLMQQHELARLVRQRTQELENSNNRLNDLNEQLGQLVHKDTLTGLRNRRFLFEQLPKDIEHYQRNRESLEQQGKCVALIHLDLDNFKLVNDQFGHSAGDSLLQQVSGLLLRETRGSDYVVRYAGEEFMLVLRDIGMDLLWDFVNRLHQLTSTTRFQLPDGESMSLSCSIGYSIYPLQLIGGQLINWEISLQLAEMALYRVKHAGKNGVATLVFDQQVDAFEFEDSLHIEAQIEQLLAEGLVRFELTAAGSRSES
ncbi:diguanylate cyclase [Alkalimonas collagenimarina]|uniref:diguanylate cyclase n=1 Tax=Alkalimonas collagenimarina TaxID=400390 RepID=A0ABT9GU96_9GAMM|nr:ligand-binding sensor domain-containing diguanylate cyclase [Alkalimonas collagenimarina]MDP4534596.1 diguanylate cyclase [Alkalimonas collagenimarina]